MKTEFRYKAIKDTLTGQYYQGGSLISFSELEFATKYKIEESGKYQLNQMITRLTKFIDPDFREQHCPHNPAYKKFVQDRKHLNNLGLILVDIKLMEI